MQAHTHTHECVPNFKILILKLLLLSVVQIVNSTFHYKMNPARVTQ